MRIGDARSKTRLAYLLELQNVTRNNFRGLDFLQSAIAQHGGLEGERLFQLVDNGTGLEFLDETDSRVEQQKRANDTKIDPILQTGGENSGSLARQPNQRRPQREDQQNFSPP